MVIFSFRKNSNSLVDRQRWPHCITHNHICVHRNEQKKSYSISIAHYSTCSRMQQPHSQINNSVKVFLIFTVLIYFCSVVFYVMHSRSTHERETDGLRSVHDAITSFEQLIIYVNDVIMMDRCVHFIYIYIFSPSIYYWKYFLLTHSAFQRPPRTATTTSNAYFLLSISVSS